ncbi:MFS transporter [Amycolatopsis sp. A133]|uniref:MFS transporter n=1 Tax=Amycolatopsis sp. A133 TaxID=3064472 RepID=UPI0027FB49A9|nr:MFS transporter [Amycolatopsis sp. A133]MDQ7809108.1 MFS transporter [Amycolatopsis sp. A133]
MSRFGLLLSAHALANLGDGIGKVALPLLATTLTRDPALIAGLSAAQFLPWLVCALPAGVLLDRVNRSRAAAAANAARALLIGGLAVLVAAGAAGMWTVYLTAVLLGAAETVADTASNALVPAVVQDGRLDHANSKLQSAETLGQNFAGGPAGSLTFAVFAALPLLLNSAGFAVAAVLLLGVKAGRPPAPGGAPPQTVLSELREGLRWIRDSPLLLRLILLIGAASVVYELALAQLVLYALEHLRLSESAFGLFGAVGGIGGLAGAALAPKLIARWGRRAALTGGLLAAGACFTAMGMTHDPVLASVVYGMFGVPVMAVNVVSATVRHTAVPERYLGRVLGAWRTVVFGVIPLGALAGGLIAKATSETAAVYVVSGVLQLVLAGVAGLALRRFGPGLNPGPSSVRVHTDGSGNRTSRAGPAAEGAVPSERADSP